jgi:hypothetical protein
MSGFKRTTPGYCLRCGKKHKTQRAAVKCLARYMKGAKKEKAKMEEAVKELHPGDIIELELERLNIYANPGHVPAGKQSKKTFRVMRKGDHGYTLRPVKKAKKLRAWRLSNRQRTLDSFTKPPLKYEVLKLTIKERAPVESVRELAQELREAVELVDKKKAKMAVTRVEKDIRSQDTEKAREASYKAKELLDIAAKGGRVSLKMLYKRLSQAVSMTDQPTLWQDVLAIFHKPAKF